MLEKVQYGRVLRLTLNRPEKRNALNSELCGAIVEAVDDAMADPGVGAILFASNGKTFCAGMDLDEATAGLDERANGLQERLFTLGAASSKPIVAAVRGAALGGGTGVVANCHIVIADAGASFGLTEIRLGLWPFLVYRAVEAAFGPRQTLALALTGRIFGAEEAKGLGLVHEIAADCDTRAMEVAQTVAAYSPIAIQQGIGFVREARGGNGEESGRVARRFRDRVLEGGDFEEGVRAFREKRAPRWPSVGN